jgi:hypothetical protein
MTAERGGGRASQPVQAIAPSSATYEATKRDELAQFTVDAVLRGFETDPTMAFGDGSLWAFRHLEQTDRPLFLGVMSRLPRRVAEEIRGELRRSSKVNGHQPKAEDALRPVGIAEFVAALEPPTYTLDGVLIAGYCFAVTGHSGHGKTAVTLTLAVAVALGQVFAGHETEQARVLYVAGENPDDVRLRVLALLDHLDLDAETLGNRLMFVDRSFTLAERHAELMQLIEAGGFGLVVLDTDQALSSDADENSNAERVEHAKRVRMLTRTKPRPTVIDLCHPPASAARNALRPRGGSAFLAEIDGNLGVWIDEGDTRAELFRTTKFRGPMFEPLAFDIKVVKVRSLTDSKGRRMTAAIAVPADETDVQADEAARARRRALLGDISMHPGATVRERSKRISAAKSTINRDLQHLVKRGAIAEAMDGHEITPKGKKWLAAT